MSRHDSTFCSIQVDTLVKVFESSIGDFLIFNINVTQLHDFVLLKRCSTL